MAENKVEQLIVKYITNQADLEEMDAFNKWLEGNAANQKVFKDFVKTNYAINCAMNAFDSEGPKKNIMQRIKQERNLFLKRRVKSYLKYAAVIVLGVSAFYFYQKSDVFTPKGNKVDIVNITEELITLQLDNGKVEVIDPINSKNIINRFGKIIGRQDKTKIMYSDDISDKFLTYNTIKIPYGKHFELGLSDGTVVYLNSGSSLRYPVRFLKGQSRQVFLNGEAYFDVAKDKKHPFIVGSSDMNVKVLGTKFNVTSYKEDAKTYTVLVEGSVVASSNVTENNEVILRPGNRAFFENKNLKTEPVDVRKYIAWVSGQLMFIDDSFGVITNKLERKYNVDIVNNYDELNNIMITATFKEENIEQVLKTFQTYKSFNYTIKNKVITITKPKNM
ncbi:FecR family protein [Flavobacterium segetis]|uniref:FecR family protein n=1 Tax=Flavobacterium segetis TaxID=271157 RepID=A0A1M5ELZ5_9FLAO|nr:FecR family protein [Flavobacterium segetis]SHF80174.1 FecR family protein [Flavobacterium segetis]